MSTPQLRRPRRDRAVILLIVLWIVVVLSLIAYSLLFQVGSETTVTAARKKEVKAEALARAGLAKAIADLRNDMLFDMAEEAKQFDGEGDVWARPEEGKLNAQLTRHEEDGMYNVRVYDEDGLLNINRFSPANMLVLQKVIEKIGYNEEDAKLVAAAIVDWRDNDQTPAMPDSPSNDEGIAYAVLKGRDENGEDDPDDVTPVVFRNEDFLTVDELLEVYGVTPELYFGPGSPEAEYYTNLLGGPQGERFKIDKRHRRKKDGPVPGLRDYFTTYPVGALNINTAPEHVLAAVAEAAGQLDGDDWAERVVKIRRSGSDEDIDNDSAFKDNVQLQANAEVGGVVQIASSLYQFGLTSGTFHVISTGEVGNVKYRLDAIVTRGLVNLTRDEKFEAIDRAKERLDRGQNRSERRTDKKNDLLVRYPAVRIVQMFHD
ncbi:hypothetical protein BH09SUM1_BH09SUM1_24360 [soil metagenome]